MQSLNLRSLISIVGGGLRAGIGFLTLLSVANALGDYEYGKYIIIYSMSTALIYFLDFQVSKVYFVKTSIQTDISIDSAVVFWLLMQIITLLGFLLIFPSALTALYQSEISYIHYAGLTACFLQHRIFSLLSQICEVRRKTHVSQLIATSTSIALFFIIQILLDKAQLNLFTFLIALACCWFGAILAMLFALKFSLKALVASIDYSRIFQDLSQLLYRGRFLIYIAFLGVLGESTDRWLLAKFSSFEMVGSYGLSKQISGIMLIFSAALFPIMIREISESFARQRYKTVYYIFIKFTDILLLVAASLVSYLLIWKSEIVPMLVKTQFLNIDNLIVFSSIAIFHQILAQSYGTFLIATGQEKLEARLTPYFVAVGVVSSFIFLFPDLLDLGGTYLVIKQGVLQFTFVTILGIFLQKKLKVSYPLSRQILIILPILSVTYVVREGMEVMHLDGFLALVLAAICQLIITIISISLLNQKVWKND